MVKKIKSHQAIISLGMDKSPELDFKKLQLLLEQMGIKSSKKGSKLTIDFDNNGQIATFLAALSS
jgi:hypothetical protein